MKNILTEKLRKWPKIAQLYNTMDLLALDETEIFDEIRKAFHLVYRGPPLMRNDRTYN